MEKDQISREKDDFITFYHTPKWISILEKSYDIENKTITSDDNKSSVFFPLFLIKNWLFGTKIVSIPYCDYGGPIFQDLNEVKKSLKELDFFCKENNVDYIEIRGSNENLEKLLISMSFVKNSDYKRFELDLQKPLEIIWNSLDKKVRNTIRKAMKSDLKIIEDKEDIKEFYKLYAKTMKKLGSPQQPLKLFENILKFCPDNLKIVFAEHKGKKIAASMFLIYNKKIYYWKNVSDEKYLNLRPNDLILYHIIEWGVKNGFKVLDLGRAKENDGTYLFKKRWGCSISNLNYYFKFYKKVEISDPSSKKFKTLSSIWSRMPTFITNIIGPSIRKNFP